MLVASFDVGIINLALVIARVDVDTHQVKDVLQTELIDTTCMGHTRVPADQCALGHTKTVTDRLMHVVQERPELAQCDVVLIERQPIQGHTDVQEVLFLLFREKAVLVSPNAMHKHFGIQTVPYEWRKVYTVQIATPFLSHHPQFNAAQRQHDMADALCILLFWLHTQRESTKKFKLREVKQEVVVVDSEEHVQAVAAFGASMRKYEYQKKSGMRSPPTARSLTQHAIPSTLDATSARGETVAADGGVARSA